MVGAVATARLVGLFDAVGPVAVVAGCAGALAVDAAEQPTNTLMATVSNPARYARNFVILMLIS
jgi:hypothetical protein